MTAGTGGVVSFESGTLPWKMSVEIVKRDDREEEEATQDDATQNDVGAMKIVFDFMANCLLVGFVLRTFITWI